MRGKNSIALTLGLASLCALALSGCMSPKSTAVYYAPTTAKWYPPKPKDAVTPIFAKPPARPHSIIGKLAFETSRGWPFIEKSILYNARANGADAAVVRDMKTWRETYVTRVPPQTDWVPTTTYYYSCGVARPVITYVPIFRPGYLREWNEDKTYFEAEMIVFRQ